LEQKQWFGEEPQQCPFYFGVTSDALDAPLKLGNVRITVFTSQKCFFMDLERASGSKCAGDCIQEHQCPTKMPGMLDHF
jgi:hypothetical protein